MGMINTNTRSRLDMERLKKMSRVAMYEREQAAARKAKIKTYTPGCLYPVEDEVGGNVDDVGTAEGPSTMLECMLADVELEQTAGPARGHGAAGGRLGEPLEDSLAEHLGEVERDVEEQLDDERQQVGGPAPELFAPASVKPSDAPEPEEMMEMFVRFSQGEDSVSPRAPEGTAANGPPVTAGRRYRRRRGAETVLLQDVYDEAWYLAEAKKLYKHE